MILRWASLLDSASPARGDHFVELDVGDAVGDGADFGGVDLELFEVLRHFIFLELFGPVFFGGFGLGGGVEVGDDALGEIFFGAHGMERAGVDVGLELFDFGDGEVGEQLVVAPHQRVADRHELAEHLLRAFGDADVVAVGLRHLALAVESLKQGHGEHDLRREAVILLELAAHEQVELLIGAAEFDVALEGDRVVALHHGVEQFVDADRLLFLEALVEVFALEHLRDGELGGEAHEGFEVELEEPLGVVANLGLFRVENLEDLRLVGFGVGVELARG